MENGDRNKVNSDGSANFLSAFWGADEQHCLSRRPYLHVRRMLQPHLAVY